MPLIATAAEMSPQTLRGANVTAQWYYDDFPGGTVFPALEKFVLHTTEGKGWPGYRGGASAPNATYFPARREIRQHFPNNVSSRALVDPSSTPVRENRDRVFQLEMICYSDYALSREHGGLWVGDLTESHYNDLAAMMHQLNRELGLPLRDTVTWKEGQKTFVSGVRLSGTAFDAYRGILGHQHVSGNHHWDPGGFRMSRLRPKLATTPPPPTGDWFDMATKADLAAVVEAQLTKVRGKYTETGSPISIANPGAHMYSYSALTEIRALTKLVIADANNDITQEDLDAAVAEILAAMPAEPPA